MVLVTDDTGPRIIVALDFPERTQALRFIDQLDPRRCRLKVGKELFTRSGPEFITRLQDRGFEVFLDLKFHDIPNTVAGACAAAADLGVWMVNVHASGGRRMLDAAREAIDRSAHQPLLIAVTVLTSLTDEEIREIGFASTVAETTLSLASMTQQAGLDGIVCSAQEAARLRQALGQGFCLVSPGIRPGGSTRDDQRRVMTPVEALRAGADYLVIGRPITASRDPMKALGDIQDEITSVLTV